MPDKFLQVIELRNYLLRPQMRERFSQYFQKYLTDSQNSRGGYILGTYLLPDEEDRFFWVRGFENMQERSRFLPEFYYGEVWQKYGQEAKEMFVDLNNVYLLKPIDKAFFPTQSQIVKIDFYFAAEGKFAELKESFREKTRKSVGADSLWESELAENDFPLSPVFQYKNLLVLITGFKSETEYKEAMDKADLGDERKGLIDKKQSIFIYRLKNNASAHAK